MEFMKNLESFSNNDWRNLFAQAEQEAKAKISNLDLSIPYWFIGELDCEYDCIEAGVPEQQVLQYFENNSKPNIFEFDNGTYYLCDDLQAEEIFQNGIKTQKYRDFDDEEEDF